MLAMQQRNEMDANLMVASADTGLGTPEMWQKLSLELDGKIMLEKPHVSKKVLLKALRMQTYAMRFISDELDRVRLKLAEVEIEARNSQKQSERVSAKVLSLQGNLEETNAKVFEVVQVQSRHEEKLKEFQVVENDIKTNRDEIANVNKTMVDNHSHFERFATQIVQNVDGLHQEQLTTKAFAEKLQERIENEEKELYLNSDHILHGQISLQMWMETYEKDGKKKEEAIRDCTEKLIRQGRNVQEMMLETRRTLDDNTSAVEDVQRLLLEKADKAKVDESIEGKYEEICNQLDKALASVIGEEDEFKRVCTELQQLVTHLSENKADKKELLEVKEQVLYDSRVRQQVENLRSFIDLKMNRDEVFSVLKSKADKDEMVALLKALSDSMNASILQAQRALSEPESALLSKGVLPYVKRGGQLPSLEMRDKCLSCNSSLRCSGDHNGKHGDGNNGSSSSVNNRNTTFQLTPVYGGGFQMGSEKISVRPSGAGGGGGAAAAAGGAGAAGGGPVNGNRPLGESPSEGFLVGVDGHVYQADPEVSNSVLERVQANEKASSRASPVFKIPNAVVAQRRTVTLDEDDDGADASNRR